MEYRIDRKFARQLDADDPLRPFREAFHLPRRDDGSPLIYLCGHSLGLQPKAARQLVDQELQAWADLGVEGHFKGTHPWYSYHEQFRDSGARLVGGKPGEVVMMNSLTVNLHLMMETFYRPMPRRFKILIDEPAFPSDLYALQSQLRHHGFDPATGLIGVAPRPGEHLIRADDIAQAFDEHGSEIALVLFSGVHFATGQWFDIQAITEAAHRHGCKAGFDLAHAAGNVPLQLHDWNVDFAVWCNYKYCNSGPGAVGGCFVHERHGQNTALPRLAGWWGNNPASRFRMDTERQFVPQTGADGWQVSNPPIFSLASVKAALDLFDAASMPALRAKSQKLTGYLEFLLERLPGEQARIITPREPGQRGCALSLLVKEGTRELVRQLEKQGIVCDFRAPDIVRAAPAPLYNSFEDVSQFGEGIGRALGSL